MAALLPDLDTRSVYHVVQENFERIGLKAVAIRMLYCGEHTLTKEEIINHIRASINDVNASYCEINVTGLLLVYDSYFVHIVEGSEDTVHRHLRFLLQKEQDYIKQLEKDDEKEVVTEGLASMEQPPEKADRMMFRRLKTLMVYHSISTLLFDGWRALTACPPTLVSKLDIYKPMAQHLEQLRVCLDKLTKLCKLATEDEDLSFEGVSAGDPKIEALPEVALLDFLLHSKYILDLKEIVHMHRRVDDYVFYFEHVWPLPTHYTPRHLYKLKIDDSFVEPLPVMPWEMVKKEAEDEDRDERQSASDSSD